MSEKSIKEILTVQMSLRQPHPTSPFDTVDMTDVEITATRNIRLIEICGVKCFVISLWFVEKRSDDVVNGL